MTSIEQHKLVKDLHDVEQRLARDDLELFTMFRKRDRDDEDLDSLSQKKLMEMHEEYVGSRRPKGNPLDALFKKKIE